MNPHLIIALSQARQDELYRDAERARLARQLRRPRPSLTARLAERLNRPPRPAPTPPKVAVTGADR
jgi:hypothetical protein